MCKIGRISALCGRESARREFARFRAMLWKWSLQQWGLHRRVRAHSGRHSHQFVERLPNVQSTRRIVWGGLHVPMQSPNICARRWCPSTRWKKSPSRSFWRHLTASTMFQGGHIFHPQLSRALTTVSGVSCNVPSQQTCGRAQRWHHICHWQCILLTRIGSWCQNASRRAFCQRTTPPLIWLMPCRMLCGSGNWAWIKSPVSPPTVEPTSKQLFRT